MDSRREFYVFEDPGDIGNLHGAIQGVLFTGFIGRLYRLYPFPALQVDFKQHTDGHLNREPVERLLREFATPEPIRIVSNNEKDTIAFGELVFTRAGFYQLLGYIDRGGMPGWQDDRRPEYVVAMGVAVKRSGNWLFGKLG